MLAKELMYQLAIGNRQFAFNLTQEVISKVFV
jgi:hypothetical protein